MSDRYGRVEVTSREQWRAWLAEHHAELPGIWLVTHKKSAGPQHVPYADVVEEALCFGWVDSKGLGLDEQRSMLLMTPRKRGSGWSRPNKERIERLTADGRIEPAGQAVIDRAREDGSWTALDAVENLEEPPDLVAALDADPDARRHWDAFPRSAKRAALDRIRLAKRPETRARRIAETAGSAARGERTDQWRPKER
jgi:uncharacterized protein YdeI (YjbR/CyaY-like superfamily)